MSKWNKHSYLLLAFFVLLSACADENPLLVNPLPMKESVSIRFINLTGDKQSRTLQLDSKKDSGPIAWGACSNAFTPPADSSVPSVILSGIEEYRLNRKVRFSKNGYYTFFALPSDQKDSIQRNMDTLIVSSTTYDQLIVPFTAKIKFINVIPDTATAFTFTMGCPNGTPFIENVNFGTLTQQYNVRSNGTAISLIRKTNGLPDSIWTYNFNLKDQGQYIIIVNREAGKEKLLLLDEFDKTISAVLVAQVMPERETLIRSINLSSSPVTIKTLTGGVEIAQLASGRIGPYTSITACASKTQDTLVTMVNGEIKSSVNASLEVLERYTYITLDSSNNLPANLSFLVNPLRLNQSTNGRAIIRVLNGSWYRGSVTISLGARQIPTGNTSGEVLCTSLKYGQLSDAVMIPAGAFPITVFTDEQPAKLLYCAYGKLVEDQNYLLVIKCDENGKDQLYLINETDVDKPAIQIESGMFSQFVNLMPGANSITLSIPNILPSARLEYGQAVTTVLPQGLNNITLQGQNISIIADSLKRSLVIGSGTTQAPDYLSYIYDPIAPDPKGYQKRFINACKGLEMMNIKVNFEDSPPIVERLAYKSYSDPQLTTLARKISVFFVNTNTDSTLYRVDDLDLAFNKTYTLIFGGNPATNKYSYVQVQEY